MSTAAARGTPDRLVLAAYVAHVVERELRFREDLRRAEALNVLATVQHITEVALGHADVDDLLAAVGDRLRSMLQADTAAFVLPDAPGQAGARVLGPGGRSARTRLAHEGTLPALLPAPSVVVTDAALVRLAAGLLGDAVHRLAVSLCAGSRALGLLALGRTARPFAEDEAHVLELVADRVGLAIERVELFEAERRARADAEAAEARYRLAFKAMHGVVWDWDVEQDRFTVSDAVEAVFGHRATPSRAWWLEQVHPEDRERVQRDVAAVLQGPATAWASEYRFRRADGTYARVADRGHVLRDGGVARRVIGAVTDVTDQRLREERDRLRALSLAILQAREDEARRIARELHDEASQLLGSAHLGLDALARQLPVTLQARIGVVRARLDEAEGRVRQLAHELRPPVLDDLGLVAAVELFAEAMTFRSRMHVDVRARLDVRLPGLLETAVYRVVQEALANAARHARASQATVTIEQAGESVRCTVRDNGAGFDVPARLATPGERGLGLVGMRERLELLGGRLDVVSRPGEGTEIRAELPLGVIHAAADPAG